MLGAISSLTQLFIHNNNSMSAGGSAKFVIMKSGSRLTVLLKKQIKKYCKTNQKKFAISRGMDNGSYTMAAWPIKSLALHYTMIRF